MSPLVAGALLIAVLLGLAAAMVWQEARKRPAQEPVTYVIEDAVAFVHAHVADRSHLREEDVRRILEWEVIYLQGLRPRGSGEFDQTRVGGSEEATRFILEQINRRGGTRYDPADIELVLEGEALYLAAIGALGPAVGGNPS